MVKIDFWSIANKAIYIAIVVVLVSAVLISLNQQFEEEPLPAPKKSYQCSKTKDINSPTLTVSESQKSLYYNCIPTLNILPKTSSPEQIRGLTSERSLDKTEISSDQCSSEKSLLKEVKKLLFVFSGARKGEDPLLKLRHRLPADVLIAGEFKSNDKSAYKKIAEIAKTELLELNSIDSPCKIYPEIAILGFSNGGNAALFNIKKLIEEENVKVTKLFLIDPVPWGHCSWKPNTEFFTPSCVGESQNFYQHLQKSSFWPPRFKWAKRGRTLDSGGTELKDFLSSSSCRGDPFENAHALILCDERVIKGALKILDNMGNLREDYQCVLKENDPVKISNFKIINPLLNGPCKIFA